MQVSGKTIIYKSFQSADAVYVILSGEAACLFELEKRYISNNELRASDEYLSQILNQSRIINPGLEFPSMEQIMS